MTSVFVLALAGASVVIASSVSVVAWAVALEAGVFVYDFSSWVSVKSIFATFAVDASSVVFAINADSATFIDAISVHGSTFSLDIFVIVASISMLVAVARDALVFVVAFSVFPFPLVKERHAFLVSRAPKMYNFRHNF